jgi:hypothetical protein
MSNGFKIALILILLSFFTLINSLTNRYEIVEEECEIAEMNLKLVGLAHDATVLMGPEFIQTYKEKMWEDGKYFSNKTGYFEKRAK